jgi:hypothetical protein
MLSQQKLRLDAQRAGVAGGLRLPQSWFWGCAALLLLGPVLFISPDSTETVAGAYLIAVAALCPAYLWIAGKAKGLPIFPLYALTHLWTYAVPLVIDNPVVMQYPPDMRLTAGAITAGFILLGTGVWYQFAKSTPATPSVLHVIDGKKAEPYLLAGLAAGVVFSIIFTGGWAAEVDGGLFALIRGVVLSVNNIATFTLAYRWGTQEMSKKRVGFFLLLLALQVISNAATLLLVGALSGLLLVLIAFSLGRRKIPFLPLAVLVLIVIPLHYGKGEMRIKYWGSEGATSIKPWEYPDLFVEWAGYSWDHLADASDKGDVDPQSIAQRAGLVQLLLKAQDATAHDVPFLNGATYVIIPRLLIPRFLDPSKPASHEGTYLLNIHFGLQTREDTLTTTIGWGMLNEAYANFGLWGVGGLAAVLGCFYGAVARWSMNCPVLSARYLFAILLVSIAYQSEFSASVYVTALFQSTVPLVAAIFLLMKKRYVGGSAAARGAGEPA